MPLQIPTLRSLGLGELVAGLGRGCRRAFPNGAGPEAAADSARRLRPHGGGVAGQGLGHRALGDDGDRARAAVSRRFPTDFRPTLIAEFERRIGRGTLGNVVASGTEIIDRLGAEHMRTGKPIVYTSADSVFQIAAHEDVIPIAEQYRICEIAFDLVGRGLGVGRVIARPFVGAPGAFTRTANRHDYALDPIGDTLLDVLTRRRHAGRRRSARSTICSPAAASRRVAATRRATPTAWTARRGDARDTARA